MLAPTSASPGWVPPQVELASVADLCLIVRRAVRSTQTQDPSPESTPRCAIEYLDAESEDPRDVFDEALASLRHRYTYLLWLGRDWTVPHAGAVHFDPGGLRADGYRLFCDDGSRASWQTVLVRMDRHWRLCPDRDELQAGDALAELDRLRTIRLSPSRSAERRLDRAAERIVRLSNSWSNGTGTVETSFWLGMHHERLGDVDSARDWFEHVVASGDGPIEQRAIALSRLAAIRQQAGTVAWSHLQAAYQRAFDWLPSRLEPLYPIVKHYRESGMWQVGFDLASVVEDALEPADGYEYDRRVYQCDLPYERMLCAERLDRPEAVIRSANRIARFGATPVDIREHAIACRARALDAIQPVFPVASGLRNRIVVIVPFYNAGDFLTRCVDSLRRQDYTNFHVYLVDDASTDGCADDLRIDDRFTLIRNETRRGCIHNQHLVLTRYCKASDIAAYVDGDDVLACDDALSHVNRFYNRTGCWVMYGQFRTDGGSYGYARPIENGEGIDELFTTRAFLFPIHLRTHRAGLFHRIAEQDPDYACLRDDDGEYYQVAEDVALMRAIFQVAGPETIRYNDRVIYTYTTNNPLSHFRSDRDRQHRACARIGKAKRLEPVESWSVDGGLALRRDAPKARLLVITLEGTEPELVCRWAREGQLPNLARLLSSGTTVPLVMESGSTTTDTFWVSALTGVNPGVHGRFWPLRFKPNTYEYEWNHADITAPPVWDVMSRAGLHSMVYNQYEMPLSIEPNVTNIQNWAVHVPRDEISSHPAEFKTDLLERFDPEYVPRVTERSEPLTEDQFVELQQMLKARMDTKVRAFRHYLARGGWDLYQVGFDEAHDAGHQMWHVHDSSHPDHPGKWLEDHGDPILALYRQQDEAVGAMIEAAGGSDVMAIIGPGMGMHVLCGNQLDEMLRAFEAHHRGSDRDAVSRRDERLFFSQPFTPRVGAIRLNVAGREPGGIIRRGEEYRQCCERLRQDFLAVRIAGTDEPATEDVIIMEDVCHGPRLDTLPDMLVAWRKDRFITAVESPIFGTIEIRKLDWDVLSYRTGDHTNRGLLISSVPLDYRGNTPVRVEAIAPTIAEYFGLTLSEAEESSLGVKHPSSGAASTRDDRLTAAS